MDLEKVAIPCAFVGCNLFVVTAEGAIVALAGGLLFLVCERCAAALRAGRPPSSIGWMIDTSGGEHVLFVLARPEASA